MEFARRSSYLFAILLLCCENCQNRQDFCLISAYILFICDRVNIGSVEKVYIKNAFLLRESDEIEGATMIPSWSRLFSASVIVQRFQPPNTREVYLLRERLINPEELFRAASTRHHIQHYESESRDKLTEKHHEELLDDSSTAPISSWRCSWRKKISTKSSNDNHTIILYEVWRWLPWRLTISWPGRWLLG